MNCKLKNLYYTLRCSNIIVTITVIIYGSARKKKVHAKYFTLEKNLLVDIIIYSGNNASTNTHCEAIISKRSSYFVFPGHFLLTVDGMLNKVQRQWRKYHKKVSEMHVFRISKLGSKHVYKHLRKRSKRINDMRIICINNAN